MGHSRLGYLPQTYEWQAVVAQLAGGADAVAVAEATMVAADKGLQLASKDAGVRLAFQLLAQVTDAAAGVPDFAAALADAGVAVSAGPSVYDLVGGYAEAVDGHLLATRGRTDFSEMAQHAAAESLADAVGSGSARLFGTTPADVRDAVAGLATERGFAELAHGFFTRFLDRFIGFHLSRELSAYVGPGRRFPSLDAHAAFRRQLFTTCQESAVIVKRFAGEWYGKTRWEATRVGAATRFSRDRVGDFVHGAMVKIRGELKARAAGRGTAAADKGGARGDA